MKAPAAFVLLAALGTAVQSQGPGPALPDLIPFQKHSASGAEIWGYADPSGRLVIPAQYEEAEMFTPDGLAEVKRGRRWGFINKQGKEVVPPVLSYHLPMSDGRAGGCMDTDQQIPGISIYGPKPGQQTPVFESKCGYFDRDGKVAIPFQYDWIHPFREGVAPVSVKGASPLCALDSRLYGLIDANGKFILRPDYCYVGPSDDGWIRVVYENRGLSDARVGFVDREGRQLIAKLPYDFAAEGFRGPLLPVRSGGLWGFIDRAGREVVPPRYKDVFGSSEGLGQISENGKWGFVDASGKVVIAPQFDSVGHFDDGLACVDSGGRGGLIDRTGKLVVEFRAVPTGNGAAAGASAKGSGPRRRKASGATSIAAGDG